MGRRRPYWRIVVSQEIRFVVLLTLVAVAVWCAAMGWLIWAI